jgi:hypothetical protein
MQTESQRRRGLAMTNVSDTHLHQYQGVLFERYAKRTARFVSRGLNDQFFSLQLVP